MIPCCQTDHCSFFFLTQKVHVDAGVHTGGMLKKKVFLGKIMLSSHTKLQSQLLLYLCFESKSGQSLALKLPRAASEWGSRSL